LAFGLVLSGRNLGCEFWDLSDIRIGEILVLDLAASIFGLCGLFDDGHIAEETAQNCSCFWIGFGSGHVHLIRDDN
jgi:hypothetical protein